ncbi:MAG: VOC family protein [Promicromonosporaceae bacterium]|nr:VOC family protein [Promicromonosporaceae bacterium]
MVEAGGVGTLVAVVIDVPDVAEGVAFWTELLDAHVAFEAGYTALATPNGWQLGIQAAPNLVQAEWPGQEHPQQLHLDLRVPDLAAATEHAVALGATLLRENATWNTLADPAGHPFDLCLSDEVESTTIWGVTFDVPDAAAAVRFWSGVLGDEIAYEGDGMAMLGGPRTVMFQQVEGYNAPAWPDPERPQQLHVDVWVTDTDPDDAEKVVVALGARRLADGDGSYRVFADPAGHTFCLGWPTEA